MFIMARTHPSMLNQKIKLRTYTGSRGFQLDRTITLQWM
jgi:hypothetical protein